MIPSEVTVTRWPRSVVVWRWPSPATESQLVRPPATIAFSWGSHNSNVTMVCGIYNYSYRGESNQQTYLGGLTLHHWSSNTSLLQVTLSSASSECFSGSIGSYPKIYQWRPQRCISHGFRSGKSGENDVVTTFYYTCLTTIFLEHGRTWFDRAPLRSNYVD